MKKVDELADPASCLNQARDDECLFVLLGRDAAAPFAIRAWAAERVRSGKNAIDDPQIVDAIGCADLMERERGGDGRKLPLDPSTHDVSLSPSDCPVCVGAARKAPVAVESKPLGLLERLIGRHLSRVTFDGDGFSISVETGERTSIERRCEGWSIWHHAEISRGDGKGTSKISYVLATTPDEQFYWILPEDRGRFPSEFSVYDIPRLEDAALLALEIADGSRVIEGPT